MSDFDKEAERERLREKYEHDEQKREVTEKMSELLLKGATMTNAHCQECGDPIFRYDGQEFCATCERTVQRATDESADAQTADGEEPTADAPANGDEQAPPTNGDREEIEVASPDETRVRFGGDTAEPDAAEPDAPDGGATDRGGTDGNAAGADATAGAARPSPDATTAEEQPARRAPEPSSRSGADQSQRGGADARQVPGVDPGELGDLDAARAVLTRTVTRLARQAEASDDLGQTRDLLAATTEAAEALSAVREAGR